MHCIFQRKYAAFHMQMTLCTDADRKVYISCSTANVSLTLHTTPPLKLFQAMLSLELKGISKNKVKTPRGRKEGYLTFTTVDVVVC